MKNNGGNAFSSVFTVRDEERTDHRVRQQHSIDALMDSDILLTLYRTGHWARQEHSVDALMDSYRPVALCPHVARLLNNYPTPVLKHEDGSFVNNKERFSEFSCKTFFPQSCNSHGGKERLC